MITHSFAEIKKQISYIQRTIILHCLNPFPTNYIFYNVVLIRRNFLYHRQTCKHSFTYQGQSVLTISNCKYLFTNVFIVTEKLRYSNLHIQISIHCNICTNAGRHWVYYIVKYINFFDFQSSVWPGAPLVTEGG